MSFCYKVLILVLLILLNSVVLAQDRVYKVGTVNWIGWSFLDVAQEKGFWEELGVNVEVIQFDDGTYMHDMFRLGQIDFTMNMLAQGVDRVLDGEEVVFLGIFDWSSGGDKLIKNKDIDLFSYDDKVIGVYLQDSGLKFMAYKYLIDNGFDFDQFRFVYINPKDMLEQFRLKRIAMMISFGIYANEAINSLNGEELISSAQIEGIIPEGLCINQKTLDEIDKGDLVKIIKGILLAIRWMKAEGNWLEFRQILNERTFKYEKEVDERTLRAMLADVRIFGDNEILRVNEENAKNYILELSDFLKLNDEQRKQVANVLRIEYLKETLLYDEIKKW